ncbi:MAG TPA: tetratricopeptide repeat protein, partial [Bryobacteraceae bacterium]|nr:tetratricopeptide repeat protein [Bryobacteraceae bacterium]
LARTLNKKIPDDVQVYGLITDACIELGKYEEAEKAAQWMLDLRPGNVAGLTRGAYLRELFGDLDGAIDFMRQAHSRIRPEEYEDRAWVLTHLGHLQLMKGDAASAERVLSNALSLFPDYHYALAKLGKVRQAQNKHAEAVELFRKRYAIAAHPENLYDVAVALHKAGQLDEARKTFAEFEVSARKEMEGVDNANRELMFYYLEYGNRAAEALRIAELEMKRRQDVHTREAYAWALHRSGKHKEAAEQIRKALSIGVKEPEMLGRASVIEQSLKTSDQVATR